MDSTSVFEHDNLSSSSGHNREQVTVSRTRLVHNYSTSYLLSRAGRKVASLRWLCSSSCGRALPPRSLMKATHHSTAAPTPAITMAQPSTLPRTTTSTTSLAPRRPPRPASRRLLRAPAPLHRNPVVISEAICFHLRRFNWEMATSWLAKQDAGPNRGPFRALGQWRCGAKGPLDPHRWARSPCRR